MDADGLSREIERLSGREALPRGERLDPRNPLHVDRAAAALLDRFFAHDDPAAFKALLSLVSPLLQPASRAITREVGLAMPSVSLLAEHMARLFMDLAPDARARSGGRHFLAAAQRALREAAEAKVRLFATAPAEVLAALAEAAADPVDVAALGRLARSTAASNVARAGGLAPLPATGERGGPAARWTQALFSTAFHRLEPLHRQLLMARDVDGLSLVLVAETVRVGDNPVASILVLARMRMARNLAELLRSSGPEAGADGPGGSAGGGSRRKRRPR